MTTCVSLLRGINVSGKNLIKMDALRQIYADLGFQDVKTYLQSGNVLFRCENADKAGLSELISKKIAETAGIQTRVFVYTSEEWLEIADKNPFPEMDESFLYITLMEAPIDDGYYEKLSSKAVKGEKLYIAGDLIYTCYPEGFGKSKLDNNSIEAITRKTATTRNRKTVNAIRDLLIDG